MITKYFSLSKSLNALSTKQINAYAGKTSKVENQKAFNKLIKLVRFYTRVINILHNAATKNIILCVQHTSPHREFLEAFSLFSSSQYLSMTQPSSWLETSKSELVTKQWTDCGCCSFLQGTSCYFWCLQALDGAHKLTDTISFLCYHEIFIPLPQPMGGLNNRCQKWWQISVLQPNFHTFSLGVSTGISTQL